MTQQKQVDDRIYEFDDDFESLESIAQNHHPAKIIRSILTLDYLANLVTILRDRSSLLELVTAQLFQHLLKVYQHKLEAVIQMEGVEAIENLPHLKRVNDRNQGDRIEFVFNEKQIKTYLRTSLSEFFTYAGFWEELANAIGTNLVIQRSLVWKQE